jgi:hypothetical protein
MRVKKEEQKLFRAATLRNITNSMSEGKRGKN